MNSSKMCEEEGLHKVTERLGVRVINMYLVHVLNGLRTYFIIVTPHCFFYGKKHLHTPPYRIQAETMT